MRTAYVLGGIALLWWLTRKPAAPLGDLTLRRPIQPRSTRIGAIERTDGLGDMAGGGGARVTITPDGQLVPVIGPEERDARATTLPWYADDRVALLNRTTPADPYALPAVDRYGNAVNPMLRQPVYGGDQGRVADMADDEVDRPIGNFTYREPGDPAYGNVLTTDYGEDVPSAYDPAVGAIIGERTAYGS